MFAARVAIFWLFQIREFQTTLFGNSGLKVGNRENPRPLGNLDEDFSKARKISL